MNELVYCALVVIAFAMGLVGGVVIGMESRRR